MKTPSETAFALYSAMDTLADQLDNLGERYKHPHFMACQLAADILALARRLERSQKLDKRLKDKRIMK